MEQLVEEATHRSGNILDLILCDQENLVTEVTLEGRLGKSDHDIIAFKLCAANSKGASRRTLPDYRKARFKEMRDSIGKKDWKEAMSGNAVDDNWIILRDEVKSLMSEFIPVKRKKSFDEPLWMDNEVKKCIQKKKDAWKKMKQTDRVTDKEEYKKMVKKVKKIIKNKKNSLERRIMKCRKSNPKS